MIYRFIVQIRWRGSAWVLGTILVLALAAVPGRSLAEELGVREADAAYLKAKKEYSQAKARVLKIERELRALESAPIMPKARKRPENGEIRILMARDFAEEDKKRADLSTQLRRAIEHLNQAHKRLFDSMDNLQKAMWFSTPPILQSVSVHAKRSGEVYSAVWESDVPDELRKKIEEQQRLLNKIETRLEERKAARRPFIEKLKQYSDTYNRAVDAYRINTRNEILGVAAIDLVGTLVSVFVGDPSQAVKLAGAVTAVASKSVATAATATDSDNSFVAQLIKYRKKNGHVAERKYNAFQNVLAGDGIEMVVGYPTALTTTCVAVASTQPLDTKAMKGLVSGAVGKDFVQGLGIGVATSLIKGLVAEHFRGKADKAKMEAFEAYIGHEFLQGVLNHHFQQDAPFFNARQQLRQNILELRQQIKCTNHGWTKKVEKEKSLRTEDLDSDILLMIRFSAPMHATPEVWLRSRRVSMQPAGSLPTREFRGQVAIPAPSKDGIYEYPIEIRVQAPDRLDGNPATTPEWNAKQGRWEQIEDGVDKSHVIKFVNYTRLISELRRYKQEISDYIRFMDKRFAYGDEATKFVHAALTNAGVKWAAKEYSGVWAESAAWRWQLYSDSAKNYLLAHGEALSDTIWLLRHTATPVNDRDIRQLREGMKRLKKYMQTTRRAFVDCWLKHATREGQLLDRHQELRKQYFATPSGPDSEELRAKLWKQSEAFYKKSREAGKTAVACIRPVRKDAKRSPAFVAIQR